MTANDPTRQNLWTSLGLPLLVLVAAILAAIYFMQSQRSDHRDPEDYPATEITKGTQLPDLSFYGLDESHTKLSELGGQVTLVNFWATWCTPCLVELPSIEALREHFYNRGLRVVIVSTDENPKQDVPPVLKRLGIKFPSHYDAGFKLSELFQVDALPYSVIIDKNGVVLYQEYGERDWNSATVRKQFEKWLSI